MVVSWEMFAIVAEDDPTTFAVNVAKMLRAAGAPSMSFAVARALPVVFARLRAMPLCSRDQEHRSSSYSTEFADTGIACGREALPASCPSTHSGTARAREAESLAPSVLVSCAHWHLPTRLRRGFVDGPPGISVDDWQRISLCLVLGERFAGTC